MPETLQHTSNEAIYQTLRQEILTLRLEPGQPLPENEISKRFGVSRTPIRSVFERLKSDLFIEVFPRRGTFVTLLDLDSIEQILYMRLRVETGILTELAQNPDRMLLERLDANLKRQNHLISGTVDPAEFFGTDSKFHELFFRAAGRGKLWDIFLHFAVHYTRYRMLVLKRDGGYRRLYEEHIKLYELLRDRNTGDIEERAAGHLHGDFHWLREKAVNEFAHYFTGNETGQDDFIINGQRL